MIKAKIPGKNYSYSFSELDDQPGQPLLAETHNSHHCDFWV